MCKKGPPSHPKNHRRKAIDCLSAFHDDNSNSLHVWLMCDPSSVMSLKCKCRRDLRCGKRRLGTMNSKTGTHPKRKSRDFRDQKNALRQSWPTAQEKLTRIEQAVRILPSERQTIHTPTTEICPATQRRKNQEAKQDAHRTSHKPCLLRHSSGNTLTAATAPSTKDTQQE